VSRLILVSNRLPVTVHNVSGVLRIEKSVGGLATGLREPHERSGGLWVGWPGPTDTFSDALRGQLHERLAEIGTVPVHLSRSDIAQFYETFSNGVLWPLFHYNPGQIPLRVEGWESYCSVNRRFADRVAELYRPGDTIWVHDYQLMLVPALLRQRIPDARIGFFLHIPFPSSEMFATLPHRETLLRGPLGADVIGFHTAWYVKHFRASVERILGYNTTDSQIEMHDRTIQVGVFPIGIDAQHFEQAAQAPRVEAEARQLRREAERILVGIDRLDYTKGIPRRLLAFEDLLRYRPEWRERVRLIQVAVPSRTGVRAYRKFGNEVNAIVGSINGAFGTPHWQPVHYVYRSIPEHQMLALYRAADAMLVTPVRDGMNLVAKEFLASRSDEDGVLILSEFAGGAAQLSDALVVNPFDIGATANAYHQALMMPRDERRVRIRRLRETVQRHDVHWWVSQFIGALNPEVVGEEALVEAS